MQFNVPQFTEREDRVIGPLTVRQFIILLAAGGLVFLAYSTTKDTVATVIVGIFVSLPALIFTFGKFNGRPLYLTIPVFIEFLTLPKKYIFERQVFLGVKGSGSLDGVLRTDKQSAKNVKVVEGADEDVRSRLARINYQLKQRKLEEEELMSKIK